MSRYGIRVIFADDHPVLTLANRHVVAAVPTIACVGDARNSTELVDLLQRTPCDVLVTDYAMPGGEYGDGRTLISFLTRRYPALKLVVMTMMDNPMVLRSLFSQRIHCVVSKSDDPGHLVPAIHAAFRGERFVSPRVESLLEAWPVTEGSGGDARLRALSQRELEVVRLFVSGMTVSEIAAVLRRTKQTISTQKLNAMRKLGIERDGDLFRYANEVGLVASASGASGAA